MNLILSLGFNACHSYYVGLAKSTLDNGADGSDMVLENVSKFQYLKGNMT